MSKRKNFEDFEEAPDRDHNSSEQDHVPEWIRQVIRSTFFNGMTFMDSNGGSPIYLSLQQLLGETDRGMETTEKTPPKKFRPSEP